MNFQKLPETGYVRLNRLLAPVGPLPISRSAWYQGLREGRFVKPVALSPRIRAYDVVAVRAYFASMSKEDSDA